MRNMGIAIKKNEIWFAVVDGSNKELSEIRYSGKENYRFDSAKLAMDFYNIFLELITKYNPEKVVYKLSLDINMQQVPYLHYSLGILNLICLQKGIHIQERSTRWITANKRKRIKEFVDRFSNNMKNEEQTAALIAWYELGD